MKNVVGVQIVDGIANLVKFLASFLFFHLFADFYSFIQRSFFHVLHHDIEVGLVTEKTIHFDYVGVIGKQIYLDLLYKLIKHESHLLLFYLFDGHHPACFFMNSWVNFSKPAFSLARAELKLLNSQLNCLLSFNRVSADFFGGSKLEITARRVSLTHKFFSSYIFGLK